MVLQSTRWLALGYFTYFFSYGIFLPFWSVWLKGIGLTPETIGLLLGGQVWLPVFSGVCSSRPASAILPA